MMIHKPMMQWLSLFLLALAPFASTNQAFANDDAFLEARPEINQETNLIEELNPFDPNVEEILRQYDEIYERETGLPSHIGPDYGDGSEFFPYQRCFRSSCRVWARINKDEQRMHLYLDGRQHDSWPVSTGLRRYETPDFDRHPNGRVYTRYTSRTYPGGDYKGLGNMPYAVFIQGGFAIHGTPEGNWSKLGQRASHGCIRLHPHDAEYFNRLVRTHGIENVWITVE